MDLSAGKGVKKAGPAECPLPVEQRTRYFMGCVRKVRLWQDGDNVLFRCLQADIISLALAFSSLLLSDACVQVFARHCGVRCALLLNSCALNPRCVRAQGVAWGMLRDIADMCDARLAPCPLLALPHALAEARSPDLHTQAHVEAFAW